jgi:glycosyltransferase involved in cell wall biosynthesis
MKYYYLNKNYLFQLTINLILFYVLIKSLKVEKEKQIENKIIRFIKYKFNKNLSRKNFEKDLPQIIHYVKLLKEGFFKNEIYFPEIIKPKISFISSVYNKEKYLSSFISSIQNQDLKDFEIILVDDCSTDNSIQIINELQTKDKRIKLIKNIKNQGALNSRFKGAMFSKGEYIIFVDSDDIVLKEGIIKSYKHIKSYNLDMVEFNSVYDNDTEIYINRNYYKFRDIIYQPVLSHIYYYQKNKGDEQNTALWDKLIKKDIALKSLNNIGENYLSKNIVIENDVIILFSLFRNADSFQYIDELGYYYFFQNSDSITNTRYNPLKAKNIIYSIFTNIEFLYDFTNENNFDKRFCIFKLIQAYKRYEICLQFIDNEFNLIKKVLNKLLESKYISGNDKSIIKSIQTNITNILKMNNKTILY